ncbi:MAG TPA: helix-turn-helix transcriptional regulator [Nocardioides sp.]|uniref:helix-turn-helix domain-containing protein n=1 Tax=Nocardioides sp. TaxID=35761 RepID=UPI002C4D4676|nr:helix-turn-helix transcriptional regulator [Nocardioides sp.]HTW16643.1 helix-turn-helix transcriptional regulator [Nocardioides sp.]
MTSERALDADQQAVVDALRAAISSSGLTQRDFARAIGTSPSRMSAYLHGDTAPSAPLLMKCQRIGNALCAAREENIPSPLDCAASLRCSLETAQRASGVLRFALEARDRLRDTLENRPHLADAWDAKATIGEKRWDTLFAALVEHEFTTAGRPAPSWAHVEPLEEEWIPAKGRQSEDEIRETTPSWLADKGILLAESALAVA